MTIIVTYTLIDQHSEIDNEFQTVDEVIKWVEGIGQEMFTTFEMVNQFGLIFTNFSQLYAFSNLSKAVKERSNRKPAQCTFGELADGEQFHLTISNTLWHKVNESDDYNAVAVHSSNHSMRIPSDAQVVRVRDTSTIKKKAEDDIISSKLL